MTNHATIQKAASAISIVSLLGCAVCALVLYNMSSSHLSRAQAIDAATPPITIAAVGDICPVRSNGTSLGTPRQLFFGVAPTLKQAHVAVGNLETSLSYRGYPADKTYTFRASPKFTSGLQYAGIDLVSVANNHALDYGRTAFADTTKALRDAGIGYAGGGMNKTNAWAPKFIYRNGAKIAYLAFSEITPANFAATTTRSGTAYTQDISAVVRAVASARRQADYVLVSMHWGVEKEYYPTRRQINEGHAIITAGANAVLAHHPHRIQGVEYYKNGIIAYSLANFVFSPASQGSTETFILKLQFGPKSVISAQAIPVVIQSGAPKLATGDTARRIKALIARTSKARGTTIGYAGMNVVLTR